MSQPIVFNLFSDQKQTELLATELNAEIGELKTRRFPDGERYLRVCSSVSGRAAIIYCNLNDPDSKTLSLLFLADTLRELGATQVGLVAPYLAYMRQDARFQPGECVSSRPFAALLSRAFDYLVTVDPHLHRYHSLDEIYSLPTRIVHSAPLIARWIKTHIASPLLIGPDQESQQWVQAIADSAHAPCQILTKIRHGDRDVEVSQPDLEQWRDRTPVLVDDIISSGRTMLETLEHLKPSSLGRPCVIAIHALFDASTQQALETHADLVSCATVTHPSNQIGLSAELAAAIHSLMTTI